MKNKGIKRKRKRDEVDPATINEERKMKNREKVRNHRLRKKKFYEDMEEENKKMKDELMNLNKKIKKLTKENKDLKKQLKNEETKSFANLSFTKGMDSNFDKLSMKSFKSGKTNKSEEIFKRNEHFWSKTIPKMIKNNPEKVKYTMMVQNKEIAGVYGTSRISFLKDQFKKILINAMSTEVKVSLIHFDTFKLEDWVKYKGELKNKS